MKKNLVLFFCALVVFLVVGLSEGKAIDGKLDVEKSGLSANGTDSQRTFVLLIQNSKDIIPTLLQMQNVTIGMIQDLPFVSNDWIGSYEFWQFDDKEYEYDTKTPFIGDLPTELYYGIQTRRDKEFICKDLVVLDALLEILTDRSDRRNIEIFVYVSGGVKQDYYKLLKINRLIKQLSATIHIIQHFPNQCYSDPSHLEIQVLEQIAQTSGGIYTTSGDGRSLRAFPLQYKSEMIYLERRSDCSGRQEFQTYVALESRSLTFTLHGDITGEVVFKNKNGYVEYEPVEIYRGLTDRMYTFFSPCKDGWIQVGSRCYRFLLSDPNENFLSWQDAKAACLKLNGTLAVVSDKQLDELLKSGSGGFNIWIGLNDLRRKGKWRWDNGKYDEIGYSIDYSYNGFKNDEPNGNNGDCVALSISGWHTTDCSTKLTSVCTAYAGDFNYNSTPLPDGDWIVEFDGFDDDSDECSVQIDVQQD